MFLNFEAGSALEQSVCGQCRILAACSNETCQQQSVCSMCAFSSVSSSMNASMSALQILCPQIQVTSLI